MSKLRIPPVGDRILVQHVEDKERARGSVIIPDSVKEKPQEAEVIALGTGSKAKDGAAIAFDVKLGDTVVVGKFVGSEVKLGEQKYTLVRQDDILGVLA